MEEIDTARLLNRCLEEMTPVAETKGITLEAKYPERPEQVLGDADAEAAALLRACKLGEILASGSAYVDWPVPLRVVLDVDRDYF